MASCLQECLGRPLTAERGRCCEPTSLAEGLEGVGHLPKTRGWCFSRCRAAGHLCWEGKTPGWLTSAFYSLKAGGETKSPGRAGRRAVQPSWRVGAGSLEERGPVQVGRVTAVPHHSHGGGGGARTNNSHYIIDLPRALCSSRSKKHIPAKRESTGCKPFIAPQGLHFTSSYQQRSERSR